MEMSISLCADCAQPVPWVSIVVACGFAVAFFVAGRRFHRRRVALVPTALYAASGISLVVAWGLFP
jgi:hypothetical protein